MGDPVKMARVNIDHRLPRRLQIEQLFQNLIALLPCLSDLADIVPKDTLIWKLKLLKSAASYTNSRIHAVKAEVLVLSRSFFSLVLVPVPLHIPRHHFIASPLHMNLCF